jgi:serine/threonine-protein kinase
MGVVHRDVKPGNILIEDSRWALLTDFGLAKILALGRQLTQSGVGVGTPDYMSPEQAQGHPVDGRADLYSFGVMLYEMITGCLPFDADSSMGVVVKHITEQPRPMREVRADVPPAVEQVIFKALAKEPTDRYPTAEAMIAALARAIGAPVPAVPDHSNGSIELLPPIKSEPKPDRPRAALRVPRRAGLIGAAGLIVILIAMLLSSGAPPPTPAVTPTPDRVAAVVTAALTPTLRPSPFPTAIVTSTATVTVTVTVTPTSEAPSGMVAVPAGSFTMGGVNSSQDANETPPHVITLGAFFIDAVEVTNVQFARFATGTGYQTDGEKAGDDVTWRTFNTPDRQRFPATHVSWNDATRYCAWAGKRLPTEAEWERAARGSTKNIYPWGNTFNGAWANTFEFGAGQPIAVATNSAASPYGAYDMVGNVWEWVQDWYSGDYYGQSPRVNPTGPATGIQKVIRGGSFKNEADAATTSVRGKAGADNRGDDIGFRCARS